VPENCYFSEVEITPVPFTGGTLYGGCEMYTNSAEGGNY
jgi:hypothetical protein